MSELIRYQGVVPPEGVPECLHRPEVAGVFVGGCVKRGVGSSFRAQAHAHTSGDHLGWICVRGWRRLYQRGLMLHELAHVLTRQGHTDEWRACLRALGGKVAAHNQKRPKARYCACGKHRFGSEVAHWYRADDMWHSWARCRPASASVLESTPLLREGEA